MKSATAFLQVIVLLAVAVTVYPQSPNAKVRSSPIGIGDVAPDFTLADQGGHKITLSDARSQSAVVLVFYRGYW